MAQPISHSWESTDREKARDKNAVFVSPSCVWDWGSIVAQTTLKWCSREWTTYRTSKAALDMLVACDAWEFRGRVKVFSHCPGYVITDLAGQREEEENGGIAKSPDGSTEGFLAI